MPMNQHEKENALRWIKAWKEAAPLLEDIRAEEIRNADTEAFINLSAGMVDASLQWLPMRVTTGLIEQQAVFQKYFTH